MTALGSFELRYECSALYGLSRALLRYRVVRKDGTFGGYRWGIKRKRALLQREAAAGPP